MVDVKSFLMVWKLQQSMSMVNFEECSCQCQPSISTIDFVFLKLWKVQKKIHVLILALKPNTCLYKNVIFFKYQSQQGKRHVDTVNAVDAALFIMPYSCTFTLVALWYLITLKDKSYKKIIFVFFPPLLQIQIKIVLSIATLYIFANILFRLLI